MMLDICHSRWFSCDAAYGRTDVSTDGWTDTDVITKTKISHFDGFLYLLTHGATHVGAPLLINPHYTVHFKSIWSK